MGNQNIPPPLLLIPNLLITTLTPTGKSIRSFRFLNKASGIAQKLLSASITNFPSLIIIPTQKLIIVKLHSFANQLNALVPNCTNIILLMINILLLKQSRRNVLIRHSKFLTIHNELLLLTKTSFLNVKIQSPKQIVKRRSRQILN